MPRSPIPEHMDDPAIDPRELALSLDYLRFVAGPLAGARALISHLARWAPTFPKGEPIRLLDVATGAADIPVAAARWARDRGFDLRVTAVDFHPQTLAIAHARLNALHTHDPDLASRITLARADALRILQPHPDNIAPVSPSSFSPAASCLLPAASLSSFPPSSFHISHASLFLHHLSDIEVMTVLAQMDRLSTRALVWSDLVRSPLCRALVHAATIASPSIVKHDARASERAGFTKSEALTLARRAGLPFLRWRRSPLLYRFTMAGQKTTLH